MNGERGRNSFMFKTIREVTKLFNKELHEEALDAGIVLSLSDAELAAQVELMITGFRFNFPNVEDATIDNVWSILPNHDEILPAGQTPEMLVILRIFFAQHMTLQSWRRLVQNYLELDPGVRLYSIHEEGHFYQKIPSILQDRILHYQLMLTKEIVWKELPEQPDFITETDRNYYFFDFSNGEKQKKAPLTKDGERKIPRHLIQPQPILLDNRDTWTLPSGRKKVDRNQLNHSLEGKPWENTAEQMDDYIKKHAASFTDMDKKNLRNWMKAQLSFHLIPLRKDPYLEYKDKTGIAGIVGAGKTTFLMMELFRIKQLGAKSALMTVNVVDALMLVYRLHLVGVKAVPLIGKSASKRHLKEFIRKVKNEASRTFERNPLSQLAMEYVLQFFDGECLMGILSGDEKVTPCLDLHKEDSRVSDKFACPLFTICGKYTVERKLREADVWVGTISAFIHTKPLPIVNPLEKTYAELCHDEMDVIFIDEADSVQEAADMSFITENKIFGEEDAVFEANFLKLAHSLDTRYDLSHSRFPQLWRNHTSEANQSQHLIFELIQESQFVREKIKNRTFGIHQLMGDITKIFFELDPNIPISDHPFFRLLRGIDLRVLTNSSDIRSRTASLVLAIKNFIQLMHDMKMYDDYELADLKKREMDETKQLFDLFISRINDPLVWQQLRSEEDRNNGLLLFRFFIYHLYFDDRFKFLIGMKKAVEILFNESIEDLSSIYRNLKRYLPFVPEAATGRNFQYFYKESNKAGAVGTFRSYDYLGIGRKFLTDFGTLYRDVSDHQGPAVCFMSGTSFAEGSYHYHVDVPLDYLLESTSEKKSSISQFIYPVYHDGKPIFISGEKDESYKRAKLKLMAEKLVPKIKEELIILSNENRKVLLVVNSYEQAMIVQQALEKFFNKRVKALTKRIDDIASEQMVLRGEVEYFADLDADVLIVPLLSINRSYNILKPASGESLFGSIFFLIRPYIPSDSIGNIIQVVNGSVPNYKRRAIDKGLQYYEGVLYIRKCANRLLNHMLLEEQEWNFLDDVERKALSWYMFINVWQMIGRLLRGQTNARVFYVDAPFAWEHANGTGKKETLQSSMLRNWVSILESASSNPEAKDKLYGEFLRGLKEALSLR